MPEYRVYMRILLIALLIAAAAAEDTIIVNPSLALSDLNDEALKDIYLGRKTSWDDGSRVVVVVLKDGPSHDHLLQLLNKSWSQFLTGWKRLVFTGKGTMPELVESEDAMVTMVSKTPGAIGFIDKSRLKDGVKALPLK
jgi:ABC-type phosphate transport system substrate-binding protein